jgi:hypothetical protein
MCQFFSFVTDPANHPAEYYYFVWQYRKENLEADDADSHSHICKEFNLREDVCNKYEYNPLTKRFVIDQINAERDDSEAAEKWANRLDFKTVVEPLVIKPIVNPLELPKVSEPTNEQIGWLKEWTSVLASFRDSVGASVRDSVGDSVRDSLRASVRDSVWYSVGDSVWASVKASAWASAWDSVRASVRYSVWESVWASVRYSVGDSVGASVGAYISTFFAIEYQHDFSSAVKLWEAGLVPAFDGTTWRLYSGKNADVVYEWIPEKEREE